MDYPSYYETTKEWLLNSLVKSETDGVVERNGRKWRHVAGMRRVGSILSVMRDDNEYCVHTGDCWNEGEEPLLGYYDINLSWDELITKIADKYDGIRDRVMKVQK